MNDDTSVTAGSGNVFADLELPDADELLIKANLGFAIRTILKQRKLTQTSAAKLLGIDQPKVSRLMRSGLYGFSIEQRIHLLGVLGQKVASQSSRPPRLPSPRRAANLCAKRRRQSPRYPLPRANG